MAKSAKAGFRADFRRFFLRGLATLLPTILTIVLLVKCFQFVQEHISVHITEGMIRLVVFSTSEYPPLADDSVKEYIAENRPDLDAGKATDLGLVKNDPDQQQKYRLWMLRQRWHHGPRAVVGFVIAIALVYIVGRFLASFIGRKIWGVFESGVQQLPLFKQVYPYVKQVTAFLFGENRIEFSRVVAVEYPSKGIWSIGFVTGAGFRHVAEKAHGDFVTVFVPSSPTPMTGYVVYVKQKEVIDLPISVEEALRFTVSGGVIVPGHQALPRQRAELNAEDIAAATAQRQRI